MGTLFDMLMQDVRIREGLKACINCGTCTAICPAAEFYDYDPRVIVSTVQTKDDDAIKGLLKSDTIWYCGECMSCKTRCPRGNAPGLVVIALRSLAQETGYFVQSEKGRQQLAIKRTIGEWILNHGYCLYLENIGTDLHPELGPIWDWQQRNWVAVMERLGAQYQVEGQGCLRKIPDDTLQELRKIFEITGGWSRFEAVEEHSRHIALEMGIEYGTSGREAYFHHVYSANSGNHAKGEE
ncbi:MAG TPA: 4Fe-4S dicluster domain-containing protein [Thermodesulfobacteriota bacterium]|nr:4Fe-4S dicluster domain-containing protein [Deltaproteobacteria bacterium]HNR13625.1 4Fe-4S dicluster domain-containing protein [Thermodesulfobacteriota bacterium]HNU71083.1 4Fe-4S dicluster domain-containing protein [Thermodesulfobacteriota bacterium]HQO78205.1 4Fe-4S dicluster domain-containing protein [Thermodesulfobacteriota bacterium]